MTDTYLGVQACLGGEAHRDGDPLTTGNSDHAPRGRVPGSRSQEAAGACRYSLKQKLPGGIRQGFEPMTVDLDEDVRERNR